MRRLRWGRPRPSNQWHWTRWLFGSPASRCTSGVPSITKARFSTCWSNGGEALGRRAAADAQAAEEARLRAETAGDRQAALLCLGVPALTTELSTRTGTPGEQSGGELASACTATRAQDTAVQVVSIRAAFSQHPFRRPQHLQPSTTSRLSVDTSDFPSRSRRPVARCGCRRMKQGSISATLCTLHLIGTSRPDRDITRSGRDGDGPYASLPTVPTGRARARRGNCRLFDTRRRNPATD